MACVETVRVPTGANCQVEVWEPGIVRNMCSSFYETEIV